MTANCRSWSSPWDTAAKSIANPMNPPATKRHAVRARFTIEKIFNLTKIDRRFLVQINAIVDFEEELAGAKN